MEIVEKPLFYHHMLKLFSTFLSRWTWQKVLSSDFNQLIKAMKDAQKNANTFLEAAYQKEMLQAAHVVAKNSKLLFDAVVACLRRARHS